MTTKDRVTIIVPTNPLLNEINNGGDKMAQIRRDRQTTVVKPEYMGALRRTRLQLGRNEQIREVILRVETPLRLDRDGAKEALSRRLPWLSRAEDEDAYYSACRTSVKLLTTHAIGEGWYCQKIRPETNERCLVANEPTTTNCHFCGAIRYSPNLRPFFSRLTQLTHAVHKERRIKLERIAELDAELDALDEALILARDRLNEVCQYKSEHGPGPVPETLVMIDIDITLSGAWQRVDVRSLVPDLIARQQRAQKLLSEIRGALCIIIQALYETAAPTIQKLVRGHILRIRFDSIRQLIVYEAEFAASAEIQRLVRAYLARIKTQRRRQRLRVIMAVRIQCLVRYAFAQKEYKERYKAHLDRLHETMALRIQRLARSWKARVAVKALVLERERQQAEAERARVTAIKDNSAVLIQSLARMYLARLKVSQHKIELTLSNRLLHLANKLKVDGDLWSFLKEINSDYRRYDAEIEQIIDREDSLASTFVEKVLKLRSEEFEGAWRDYRKLKDTDAVDAPAGRKTNSTEVFGMYKAAPREKKLPNKEVDYMLQRRTDEDVPSSRCEMDRIEEIELAGLSYTSSHKFPGDMLLRDVPDLLDDSIIRLLRAVTIRCYVPSFMPEETAGNDAYYAFLNLPPGLEKARHEAEARDAAEPIISKLNQMGFIYIRDAMPRSNFISLLESMTAPISDGFISRCNDILIFLEKAHQVNNATRNSLKNIVADYMQTQKEIKQMAPSNGADDEDIDSNSGSDVESLPGGLWNDDVADKDVSPRSIGAESSYHRNSNLLCTNDHQTADVLESPEKGVVDSTAVCKAQHDFEQELDSIVSSALVDLVQHDTSERDHMPDHGPQHIRQSTKHAANTMHDAILQGFEGGLFRRSPKDSDRKRPVRSGTKRGGERCWAVPYTSHVMRSHPKYDQYRNGRQVLVDASPAATSSRCSEARLSDVLDGLPEDMQTTIQDMFAKRYKK